MRYQLSPDVLAANLEDETVLLDMRSKNYVQLNATASWIWKGLERGRDLDGLTEELCTAFEVERSRAEAELMQLLAGLEARGLLSRVHG